MRWVVLFLITGLFWIYPAVGYAQVVPASTKVGRVPVAPSFTAGERPSQLLVETKNLKALSLWLAANYPKVKVRVLTSDYLMLDAEELHVEKIILAPGIKAIDRCARAAREETVLGNFDHSVNSVPAVHTYFPSISGHGLTLSVKEKPFDVADIDLKGRVVLNDQFDEPATLHASLMATLAAGGGNSSPFARGAAWAAMLTTSDFVQLFPDEGTTLANLNVTVQNHSYGVGLENYYGLESRAYDQQQLLFPAILHVFSAGNQGNATPTTGMYSGIAGYANLTGQFKVSKNTLTVGSSDRLGEPAPLSSRGPAHDGRIKPELIAFGDAGTSEAAAVVSGIALQVQQAYQQVHASLPDAALVKAVLINSANEVGRTGPDWESGYGSADALGAVRTVLENRIFTGTVMQGDETIHTLIVPPGVHELKITLVWNDRAAEAFVAQALVHDLDMRLEQGVTGVIWHPWILDASPSIALLQQEAQRGVDRSNNVEQITVTGPEAGTYHIRVTGHDLSQGPQPYFIAYEFNAGFEWTYPTRNYPLRAGENQFLRWNWFGTPKAAQLQFKYASESDWTTLEEEVNLSGAFEWVAPDTSAQLQFRMVVEATPFETEILSLSPASRVFVGYNCSEELLLQWKKVEAANTYVVYALGEKYMEPIVTTTDTFALINKTLISTTHYSFAPQFGEQLGARYLTLNLIEEPTDCHLIAFNEVSYYVADEARFTLQVGTTYNLKEVALQLQTPSGFAVINKTFDPTETEIDLIDPEPGRGYANYRAALTTSWGERMYSPWVEVFGIGEDDIYVYPNPVRPGEVLSLLVNDSGEVRVDVIDMYGRTIGQTVVEGDLKLLPLSEYVPAGTYVLRVHQQNGKMSTARVVVWK